MSSLFDDRPLSVAGRDEIRAGGSADRQSPNQAKSQLDSQSQTDSQAAAGPGEVASAPSQGTGAVVPLNDAAALYRALAEQIVGAAADWSPTAIAKLEARLGERYGPQLGESAVERLVELACRPSAA